MIEYICKECDVLEMDLKIIPKKKCPKCKLFLEVIEKDQ